MTHGNENALGNRVNRLFIIWLYSILCKTNPIQILSKITSLSEIGSCDEYCCVIGKTIRVLKSNKNSFSDKKKVHNVNILNSG